MECVRISRVLTAHGLGQQVSKFLVDVVLRGGAAVHESTVQHPVRESAHPPGDLQRTQLQQVIRIHWYFNRNRDSNVGTKQSDERKRN